MSTAHAPVLAPKAPSLASERRYWAPEIETRSRAEWDAQSLRLLQAHLRYAYGNAPYYRARFDAARVHPDDVRSLDDLRRFPLLDKGVLRARQQAVPLLGDLAAVPEDEVVYVSASSGSTGVPTLSPFT
ncbi:MAG TPA: CoF synthetase, partial [Rhodospirillum rubrum]|nr:CoF synthetase [Rhodospirillum rubrum]